MATPTMPPPPPKPVWERQPPGPPRKRWGLIVATSVGLLILLVVAVLLDLGQSAEVAPAATEDTPAGMGEPAADGQFTFTVDGIECGAATIDRGFTETEAQGQWCELAVTVENTGTEARRLSASNQYLYDSEGRRHSASTLFGMTPVYEQINPGNSVTGAIYFDVPVGAVPDLVQLRDAGFSGGVTVELD